MQFGTEVQQPDCNGVSAKQQSDARTMLWDQMQSLHQETVYNMHVVSFVSCLAAGLQYMGQSLL